ncbi:hypothetical protein [Parasphaerochaeta coccoides]|uniref:Outer membrane protein beta-barrel domain-containing protein n=1 Tax=Parasphaerochaeta coccoides (strain ATCC BAA-1237 / DSM 17374 / SPN1) TaxID=760011 RepID=F4GKL8_PARC1|nr:hypothetical protein [Parasphaerochaeta coccoides]AEC01427.1 hypothetical protein Spico_0190 [Parasphaerochaeta coccoides DSM 17374]
MKKIFTAVLICFIAGAGAHLAADFYIGPVVTFSSNARAVFYAEDDLGGGPQEINNSIDVGFATRVSGRLLQLDALASWSRSGDNNIFCAEITGGVRIALNNGRDAYYVSAGVGPALIFSPQDNGRTFVSNGRTGSFGDVLRSVPLIGKVSLAYESADGNVLDATLRGMPFEKSGRIFSDSWSIQVSYLIGLT